MKKILLSALLAFSLHAEIVDRIVATVDNQPITSYEIAKVSKEMNLQPNQALNYLIDQKILQEQIKKQGITVDDYDLENAMEKIAKQNGMSLFEFKNVLEQRGEYQKFKKALKEKLLKDKLFAQIVNTNLKITPQDIKNYYQTHKDEFKTFKTVQVTKYVANNPEILKKLQQNTLLNLPNVSMKAEVYSPEDLPKNLLFLFQQTKVGQFTPIINQGTHFITYYISRKDGEEYLPLSSVQNIIAQKIAQQRREQILKEYFSKLKNRADIKIFNN
ncbi:peptidyl-prolyl cis-trans isomerase [Caminibacter pacificus]|jgi:hypothetical protein